MNSIDAIFFVGHINRMQLLSRITFDPNVMGGKPCIRGMRVTVGTIVGLVASKRTREEILKAYPYLEDADISEALSYAAWRVEEIELPLDIA
jgi:uncharacterized protein (DUF433 family)